MLDGKITIDDKNRYSEALEQKRQDLRREIDKLERNQGLNEATIDYVCNFMTKPAKLWKDADLETRQAFQKMLFPNGLHFDIKDKIFGTDDLNPLFSVIRNKKESCDGSNSEMVISAGVKILLSKIFSFLRHSVHKDNRLSLCTLISLKGRTSFVSH